MILYDETTWPKDVMDFMKSDGQPLLDYELTMIGKPNSYNPYRYDLTRNELTKILMLHSLENAFHCTKLTEDEIAKITQDGMQLPDLPMLIQRINRLKEAGVLTPAVAAKLIANNEADGQYRKHILHFVFQSPHFEGHNGIGRFFTSWGGEALYNSHEEDPETGPVLRNIGIPCIVQVNIPIAHLGRNYLINKITRIYFKKRGLKTQEPIRHEDYTKYPIPASNIIAVHRFPEPMFLQLSGCQNWRWEDKILL